MGGAAVVDPDMLEEMIKAPEVEEPVYSIPFGGDIALYHDADGHEINVGDKVAHEANDSVRLIVVGFVNVTTPLESILKVIVTEYADEPTTNPQAQLFTVGVDAHRLRIVSKAHYEDPVE